MLSRALADVQDRRSRERYRIVVDAETTRNYHSLPSEWGMYE
jgi:hypothetical protein